MPDGERRLIAFLGRHDRQPDPGRARRLPRRSPRADEPGDRFLIGTDLLKDIAISEAAYNDSEGVTAEFNLNVLGW